MLSAGFRTASKTTLSEFQAAPSKTPGKPGVRTADRRRRQALTDASRLMRRSVHAASIAGGQKVCGTIIGTTLDGCVSTGNQSPDSRPSGRCERIAMKLLSIGAFGL